MATKKNLRILSTVMKNMKEEQAGIARNIL
jgi:hypothetical protein